MKYFLSLILCLLACQDPINTSTPEITKAGSDWENPSTGLFDFQGNNICPGDNGHTDIDAYKRFYWFDPDTPSNSLELASSTQATPVYNFEPILSRMRSLPVGGSFSFRIRSMYNYTPGKDASTGKPKAFVPPWLRTYGFYADSDGVSGTDVFVPDFNSNEYLSAVEALLSALKNAIVAEFGALWHEKIGFIDIGLYGQFGEWYVKYALKSGGAKYQALSAADKLLIKTRESIDRPFIDYDSAASGSKLPLKNFDNIAGNPSKRIMDAHLNAFGDAQLVMFALSDRAKNLEYLFQTQSISSKPVGLRFDGLGKPQFLYDQWQAHSEDLAYWTGSKWADSTKGFKERWKIAPFVAEFFGASSKLNGVTDSAFDQISIYHINQVSNGNITSTSGTSIKQWESLSRDEQDAMRQIGNKVGYHLSAKSPSITALGGGQYRININFTNLGTTRFYQALKPQIEFTKGSTQTIDYASSNTTSLAALAPGQSLNWVFDITPAIASGTWNLKLHFVVKGKKFAFSSGTSINLGSLVK